MKVLSLDLLAYGPFTDVQLDLSAGSEGLHVVYGPNEAGKSSALRALEAFFYGVPGQTSDDFLHPYGTLRVGARLRRSDGLELHAIRRKKNKDSLIRAGNEEPLPDDALTGFLGGVDRSLFTSLFGIGHETLVKGGQSLLAQRGHLGQVLFSAGLGTTNLHGVIRALEDEAAQLFSPRKSKARIHQLLEDHAQAAKEVSAEALSGARWEEQRKRIDALQKVLEEWKGHHAHLQTQKARLERIRAAQPFLAARALHAATVEELAGTTVLAEDFAGRREAAEKERDEARKEMLQAEEALTELRHKDGLLEVPQAVLDQEKAIGSLHQELGGINKGVADRGTLVGEVTGYRSRAEHLLATFRPTLPPEQMEDLRPLCGLRTHLEELEKEHLVLENHRSTADTNAATARRKLEAAQRALEESAAPPTPDALRAAIGRAKKAGDLDDRIAQTRAGYAEALRKVRDGQSKLQPPPGVEDPLEATARLPVPSDATLEEFEGRWTDLVTRQKELARVRQQHRTALETCADSLQSLLAGGQVPTEGDLAQARKTRDAGWSCVQNAWREHRSLEEINAAYDPEMSLPRAFERSILTADDLADRMRREADRVSQHASLTVRRKQLEELVDQAAKEENGIQQSLSELREEWSSLWAPAHLSPRTPKEMRVWLAAYEVVKNHHASLMTIHDQTLALDEQRNELIAALRREMRAVDVVVAEDKASLAEVLDHAETVLREIDDAVSLRGKTADSLPELQSSLNTAVDEAQTAREALDLWRVRWSESMTKLGLGDDVSAREATHFLDQLDVLFGAMDEAQKIAGRIDGIDADVKGFEDRVRQFCQVVAPDLAAGPASVAVLELQARLSRARQDQTLRKSFRDDIRKQEDHLRDAKARGEVASDKLAALCREAGCTLPEEIPDLEERSAKLRKAQDGLAEARAQLERLAYGLSIDQLEATASQTNPDGLPGQIQLLETEITDLATRIGDQLRLIGTEDKVFRDMGGPNRAAQAAQDAQELRAGLRAGASRYARTVLAARVLRDEIDRFRAENQDPMLTRAGEFFSQLTCSTYQGLRAAYDEKDEPTIVAVKAGGNQVPVTGMSDGTRDQVYLALRLAAVERHIAKAEPLPFVVDDILIHFDDERTRATLQALAEAARTTQVILFTHHRHVADLGRGMGSSQGVFLHQLH